ncbi:glutamine amidotransferase [Ralstonia nicotianae]|uniref:glutamine amidotransferase n=1 Tax=Ralstonia pseudosolanacearum TaxID=1310165 RepID=UPI001E5EAAF4|nr:glutamine amidotransferase [Ralstonia pseudosolanacearum]MDO3519447.1 glutamine amidotransferase [Ralstonia pseudosolanacearum]UZF20235.1 glutamine amidotransferase [Ralstonia solanacearum]UZF35242.1 glutamine amidotransferase [Ralstonia sp. RS647]
MNTILRPLLLIQAGTPPDAIRAQVGDLPRWFGAAMDRDSQAFEIVRVFEGAPLPEPDVHRAAIITGSWSMVTDLHAWSEATADWIRRAVAINTPLFGVCYGHQLMAHALGGKVGYHPRGREMGCMDIERLPLAQTEPLLAGAPQRFKAHLTHLQTVVQLPAGAEVLARSAHDPHQVVRYSPTAISTQFHPEFTPAISSACISTRRHVLREEGLDPTAMLSQLDDTPTPLLMLRRFVEAYA